MSRRQTMPERWLIADERMGGALWPALQRLPPRSGVLVIRSLEKVERGRLLLIARRKKLTVIVGDARIAARVHNSVELRRALTRRVPLILISPIRATRSHPDWKPMPRMRAATLARLTGKKAVALGGMDARRYAKLAQLGFAGWAGIDAWLQRPARRLR